MNVDSGARLSSCWTCISNSVAANVRGIKKKASSVSFATECALAMDQRLSSRDMFEVREVDAACNFSITSSICTDTSFHSFEAILSRQDASASSASVACKKVNVFSMA